jgi:hypothetical protein
MIAGSLGRRLVGPWTRLRRGPFGAARADLRVARVLYVLIVLTASLSGAPGASAASSVVAWGENDDGQLGSGIYPGPDEGAGWCSQTPVPVSGLSGVTDLAGGSQGLVLLSNGTVMAWGRNARGQLGDGCCENSDVPEPVPGLSGVTAVAASYGISMALLSNGTVMDWGENGNGQLGDGTYEEDTPTPVRVFMLKEVTAIAAGGSYGLALLKNGTVMTWGSGGGAKNSYILKPTPMANTRSRAWPIAPKNTIWNSTTTGKTTSVSTMAAGLLAKEVTRYTWPWVGTHRG